MESTSASDPHVLLAVNKYHCVLMMQHYICLFSAYGAGDSHCLNVSQSDFHSHGEGESLLMEIG